MGGVLFNQGGIKILSFSWSLGKRTNKQAEWDALLHGLEALKELKIENCQIFGDSWIVIQKLGKLQDKQKKRQEGCIRKFWLGQTNFMVSLSSELTDTIM